MSLRFGASDNGLDTLGSGWAGSELTSTWTDGTESTLRLPPFNSGGPCVVRITGSPFVVEGFLPSQEILISVNGTRIGSATIRELALIEFEIPRAMLAAGDRLVTTLSIPGARCPSEFTGTPDRRVLGFCLEQLIVTDYSGHRADCTAGPPSSPETAGC